MQFVQALARALGIAGAQPARPAAVPPALLRLAVSVVAGYSTLGAGVAPALPSVPAELARPAKQDWLVDSTGTTARVGSDPDTGGICLDNGLVRRTFVVSPNVATVGFDNRMTGTSLLRAVEPELVVTIDGRTYPVGGLRGQRDRAYLLPEWIGALTNAPGSFVAAGHRTGATSKPFDWKRKRHAAALPWPAPGVSLAFDYHGPDDATRDIQITVHYELYDGLPVIAKWFTLTNRSTRAITLDRFTSERLAMVEAESAVDERPDIAWRTPAVQVLSDFMFKGMDAITGNQVASWQTDPEFRTQVSYAYKTPCVLVCQPPIGPGVRLEPGQGFTSFRSCVIVFDSTERERQGLAVRRAHRTLAPWSTESPVMMHVRNADTKSFRLAVDQCAEVGFEMIIYTFGSGLNMESDDPAYLAKIRADVDYAHSKGIEVGGYSLFSSRRIDDANDVVNPKTGKPGGAIFGNAPCFGSRWGIDYLRRLTNFITVTGMDLLEHDGPYPGDVCASTSHPGHRGEADSQWVNWRMSADLYQWCRQHGVYINQPDYYFLSGGNKTAMGYREDNWSLPREQQLIHARQNIFDGTWTKPQTAGWMFVPLTEYHGGGAAATIEPLKDHLDAYEGHLVNTLGSGVQACWRGPRLYDSDETKALVKRWVTWFKEHRDILESDIIHCRRADGRDLDWVLHVNPTLRTRALAMVHNPLSTPVVRTIPMPLHYAGLSGKARWRQDDGRFSAVTLDDQQRAWVTVRVPARSHAVVEFEKSGRGR